MENEIGEYGRTNLGNIIKFVWFQNSETGETYKNKVILVDKMMTETYPFYYFKKDEYIVKHSPNLINILEIGDFIHTDYGWGWYHHKIDENTIVIDDGDEFIDVNKDEIHRILTQEIMWDNSYEV